MKGLEKDEEQKKLEEETELRLGLPGNNTANKNNAVANDSGGGDDRKVPIRKRGFSDLTIASPNVEIFNDNNSLLREHGVDADPVKSPSK